MSLSGLPFDDIRDLVAQIPDGDTSAGQLARHRSEDFAHIFGSQGKQADLCEWMATWSGKSPGVTRPMLALFAGNHGICERYEQVSDETTLATVTRLAAGGGMANQACASFDIGLKVFDLALQFPVADISREDALDEKGSAATIGFGMEAIAGGVDVLGLAGFGAGSGIANNAFMRLLLDDGGDLSVPGEAAALVDAVLQLHGGARSNPLELLRRLGGREHSALAGAILAARTNHVPVVLEGQSAAVVVLLFQKLKPDLCDHCCFAGLPDEGADMPFGYREAIRQSGLLSVLDGFGLAVDGANAAQAIGLLKSTAAVHRDSVLAQA